MLIIIKKKEVIMSDVSLFTTATCYLIKDSAKVKLFHVKSSFGWVRRFGSCTASSNEMLLQHKVMNG